MPSRVDVAIQEALRRQEEYGEVSANWIRTRYPDCWEEALGAIQIERALNAKGSEVADLGPYRLGRLLGKGGMGSVYEARLRPPKGGRGDGTVVAIKVLRASVIDSLHGVERFLREAELGSAIRHPNVARTFRGDVAIRHGDRVPYLVMELLPGRTLREVLNADGQIPEERCRAVVVDVAKGLSAVHAVGAVHRDVKPGNLFLTTDGVVKVMDLGIARMVDSDDALTKTGAFLGTYAYAPLEQLLGSRHDIDARCDLYALGVTLYELATGATPFAGCDGPEMILRKQDPTVPRIREVEPDVSTFFDQVVATLMAPEPGGRYESAEALLDVLQKGPASASWRRESVSSRARSTTGEASPHPKSDRLGWGCSSAMFAAAVAGAYATFRFVESDVWRGVFWTLCAITALAPIAALWGGDDDPPGDRPVDR